MIDELLSKAGLKYSDLNPTEKETFNSMLDMLNKSQLTPETLKSYISRMKNTVEEELSKEPEYIRIFIFKFRNDKNILLKARLRNYLLLEAFLDTPKKAKEALERAIAGMIPKK